MNKRFLSAKQIFWTTAVFSFCLLVGQESGYLAQKLMVENNLRHRITEALSKVIDDQKYVVDVSVNLEMSRSVEEQYTIMTGDGAKTETPGRLKELSEAIEAEGVAEPQRVSGVGLPIPGFDFEVEPAPSIPEPTPSADETYIPPPAEAGEKQVLSRTHTETSPSVASIKSMDISIILQEGAAPELIENIRQVVMVASRFNRARGDALSIMTASFKERRDQKTAEQVLLKNIAEKLQSLEQKTAAEAEAEEGWQVELEQYKENEARRREEDRLFFQSKLADLELAARARAYEDKKEEILKDDSMKLDSLDQDIQQLKQMLSATSLPDSEAQAAASTVALKEQEKSDLDAQIEEKLAMLESIQADLDRSSGGGSMMMVVFMSLLAALVIILVVVLVIMIMGNKAKQQAFPPPPPWMYPPRPRKKKGSNVVNGEPQKTEASPQPAMPAPTPPPAAAQPSVDDPSVIQSEIDDMKQSIVSMSVGQPTTATKIVQDWIVTEAPAPPEPEAAPAAAEPAEEESGGKKKKKKKKKK